MQIVNERYVGSAGREALIDLHIPDKFNHKILVFVHGYMGFKDWGAWNLMQAYFVEQGFGFCKLNLTHNGTTIDQPLEFADLNAFGKNRYSYEKNDLLCALDWIENKIEPSTSSLHLIGHSRGGGIALLCASDSRISSVITLAAISSIEKRFDLPTEVIENWKKTGVRYIKNGRTHQDMPHSIEQLTDFESHQDELDIRKACLELNKPVLILHGDQDESVSIEEGKAISLWTNQPLHNIQSANHTFGASHPYQDKTMPKALLSCCQKIVLFLCDKE
jgi:pimeloyl-ACP methyl ester carboxylesterase